LQPARRYRRPLLHRTIQIVGTVPGEVKDFLCGAQAMVAKTKLPEKSVSYNFQVPLQEAAR
jgi:hypothetical protein